MFLFLDSLNISMLRHKSMYTGVKRSDKIRVVVDSRMFKTFFKEFIQTGK